MAFTMATFMTAILMFLIMTSIFFNAMDQMYFIQDGALTITVLDVWCTTFVTVYVYHWLRWFAEWRVRPSAGAE